MECCAWKGTLNTVPDGKMALGFRKRSNLVVIFFKLNMKYLLSFIFTGSDLNELTLLSYSVGLTSVDVAHKQNLVPLCRKPDEKQSLHEEMGWLLFLLLSFTCMIYILL